MDLQEQINLGYWTDKHRCPVCNTQNWEKAKDIVKMPFASDLGDVKAVPLTCKACGFILLLSTGQLTPR